MPRIALTGATGFIGKNLMEALLHNGCIVKALVRRPPEPHSACLGKVTWIQGHLHDRDSIRRLTSNVDIVIHCAGAVRGRNIQEFCHVNLKGTSLLAETCLNSPSPPRFILVSSLAARKPELSAYAYSKKEAENALCKTYSGKSWIIFRPPAVYGPGDRELMPLFRLISKGICPIIGDGRQRISLIHVGDLAKAIKCAAFAKNEPTGIYELHDGKTGGYTWHDIINTVSEITGRSTVLKIKIPAAIVKLIGLTNIYISGITGRAPMLTPGKVNELVHPDWTADNRQIITALGWEPSITLGQGLTELFQTFPV